MPVAVFLDLSKAFNTLDHPILLYKLKYYGIQEPALNWIRNYLYNRSQYRSSERTLETLEYLKALSSDPYYSLFT